MALLAQQPSGGATDPAGHTHTRNENIRASGHARLQFGNNYTTAHYHGNHQTPTREALRKVNTEFLRACGQGESSARLDCLLQQGASINRRDRVNCTPLHHAAFEGRVDTVKYLLAAGADMHALDRFFGTPLCLAALKGHLAVVDLLIENNVNLAQDCEHFGTAAHAACAGGKVYVVRALAVRGANFEAKAWVSGVPETILEKGFRTIWEFPAYRKLSLGIDRAKAIMHISPGAAALSVGRSATVKFCLDMEHGLSVSEVVEAYAYAEISRATLIGQKTGAGLAMIAASELDPELLSLLLTRGCDATSFDSDRDSAISAAVGSSKDDAGFEPCIRLLLSHGSNINARHEHEVTALMLAIRRVNGFTRAQVLIRMGASVNPVDDKGESALMHAIRHSPAEMRGRYVRLLLDHGADVNRKNNCGQTAFDIARERTGNNHGEVQSILSLYGARHRGSSSTPAPVSNVSSESRSGTVRTLTLFADLVVALASKRS